MSWLGLLALALAGNIAWQFAPADTSRAEQPRAPSQVPAPAPDPAVPGRPADLAAAILALSDAALAERLDAWRSAQTEAVGEAPE